MPLVTALMPSEASLLRGDIPRDAEDEVDGLLSFPEKSVLLNTASTPSEASLLLGETPRDGVDELTTLLSFSAKSTFLTISLTPSEVSRLLGEVPLDEAGLLSFSGKSTLFDRLPMPPEVVLLGESPLFVMGSSSLSDDFVVVCDAALDTLDTDALGEMLGDETDEESVLLSFSVRSMLSDAAVLIGDALLDEIVTDAGLRSLPTLMLLDTSFASLRAADLLGEPPRDDTDEETKRSILSARSLLLDNAFAAEDIVVLFGETPRDGTDGRADLLILSVRSMLLDIAIADTLPPIIAGQRWWSITLACGFSNSSGLAFPLDGLLFLSAGAASLILV